MASALSTEGLIGGQDKCADTPREKQGVIYVPLRIALSTVGTHAMTYAWECRRNYVYFAGTQYEQ